MSKSQTSKEAKSSLPSDGVDDLVEEALLLSQVPTSRIPEVSTHEEEAFNVEDANSSKTLIGDADVAENQISPESTTLRDETPGLDESPVPAFNEMNEHAEDIAAAKTVRLTAQNALNAMLGDEDNLSNYANPTCDPKSLVRTSSPALPEQPGEPHASRATMKAIQEQAVASSPRTVANPLSSDLVI